MSIWIGFVGLAALGAWFRYNLNLSQASAEISRAMASGALEPGLQDAITPPFLALNYYVCFVAILVAYFGLPAFDGWNILAIILALGLGGACASPKLVPGAGSPYWVRVMHRSLHRRAERYGRHGNGNGADAMKELADRLELTFPNALQPSEADATK